VVFLKFFLEHRKGMIYKASVASALIGFLPLFPFNFFATCFDIVKIGISKTS
jgi:hypothetical protein